MDKILKIISLIGFKLINDNISINSLFIPRYKEYKYNNYNILIDKEYDHDIEDGYEFFLVYKNKIHKESLLLEETIPYLRKEFHIEIRKNIIGKILNG